MNEYVDENLERPPNVESEMQSSLAPDVIELEPVI